MNLMLHFGNSEDFLFNSTDAAAMIRGQQGIATAESTGLFQHILGEGFLNIATLWASPLLVTLISPLPAGDSLPKQISQIPSWRLGNLTSSSGGMRFQRP